MTTKTNPTLDVAAIRAVAEAATPGPWESSFEPRHDLARVWAEGGKIDICAVMSSLMDERFIAAARTAVPALCDALEAALAEVALLRARLRKTAQFLTEEVGAAGPADADEVAEKAAADIRLMRAVVDALPRCACAAPATTKSTASGTYLAQGVHRCDACAARWPTTEPVDLPYAAALRALFAGGAR